MTRTFEFESFSELDISDAFEVRVRIDAVSSPRVLVEIDDNLVDRLAVQVEGDRLQVGLESGLRLRLSDRPVAEITMGRLDALLASGASGVAVDGLQGADIEVEGSGASHIELTGDVSGLSGSVTGASRLVVTESDGGTIDLDISGASQVSLVGATQHLRLRVSGASRVTANNLSSTTADLQASGASTIEALVEETVTADASGASTIVVFGEAEIQADTSGASSVKRG